MKLENISARFGRILDNSFNEIYIFDAVTLYFVQVNLGARQNLGYTSDEMARMTPLDLKPELSEQDFKKLIEPLLLKKEPMVVFQTVHQRTNGSLYPVEVRLQLMHDEFPPVFVAIIQDITERLEAEEKNQKQLNQLSKILEGTASTFGEKFYPSLVKNLAEAMGYRYAVIGKIIENPLKGIQTLAFYSDGEIVENMFYAIAGTPCEKVIEGELCLFPNNVQKTFPDDKPLIEMEVESYLGIPLFDQKTGKPIGLLAVMHDRPIKDIDSNQAILKIFAGRAEAEFERQRIDQDLKMYARELERSNNALNEFASIASHDLQAPLRKIIAFGDRIQDISIDLDDRGKDYIARLQKSAQRMQQFISDLLEFSKISFQEKSFERVNLETITREVTGDLEVLIKNTEGRINIKTLPTLEANPMQMRQLLQNLIGNSFKYRKKGVSPCVSISSRLLENGFWEIQVVDNGIGFDEKYTDRIFNMFQRLHGRSQYDGSGIGLAICKKIVENHGGTIHAKSSLQKGATFFITLPEKRSQIHDPKTSAPISQAINT
jgi:PAS domain S-box-containing protein